MLTVTQALDQIVREVGSFAPERVALDEALGLVTAENVISQEDSPPFDKALMDGYAVVASDIAAGLRELIVVDEVTAGRTPSRDVASGQATRIMTGAPTPVGVDAVVPVERTELVDEDPNRVRILLDSIEREKNIIRRGTNKRVGEQIVSTGRLLRAQELAALAEMGFAMVSVRRQPCVAVLATGDELVSVDQTPGPGQIRNSNETMLCAQLRNAGGVPVPLGIARDNREDLRRHIDEGLNADILLLSGGVSAGKLDLVPSELELAGVEQVFHKVRVKPGKPVWFGVSRRGSNSCLVFGLPGNPVSSMVCFELFVRTAIRRLTGQFPAIPRTLTARLTHSHSHTDDRETYFPAAVEWTADGPMVRLMKWHGSSDLQSTVDANSMVIFPPEPKEYAVNDRVEVVLWNS
ncbi:MAG: molybdopterin molybdotransferase MoeA [Planctomycetota bacterium]|nr:molybdopterin molybdotransferase MoeA [Planctomycetota bacterium]